LEDLSKLDDIQLVNEGAIASSSSASIYKNCSRKTLTELTYWLREGRASNAEVDFVMAFESQIVPIEVKAGGRGSLRSLHQFVGEKHVRWLCDSIATLPRCKPLARQFKSAIGRPTSNIGCYPASVSGREGCACRAGPAVGSH